MNRNTPSPSSYNSTKYAVGEAFVGEEHHWTQADPRENNKHYLPFVPSQRQRKQPKTLSISAKHPPGPYLLPFEKPRIGKKLKIGSIWELEGRTK